MEEHDSVVNESRHIPVRLSFSSFDPEKTPDVIKPPIIFLHGLTSCKETWRSIPQAIANETKRKAYAYDARNHGESDWSEDFTPDLVVLDLFYFMDSINTEKAILIGHSMGGVTVINAALMKPERVEVLIVEDMFVKRPSASLLALPLAFTQLAPRAVQLVPEGADEKEAAEFILNYICESFPSEKRQKPQQRSIDHITLSLRKLPKGRYELKANMPALEKALRTETKSILVPHGIYNGPTCFIYGKQSSFKVHTDAENIQKHFPEVVLVGIENSSHSVHSDCPREFLKEVLDFLSTHGESKAKEQGCKQVSQSSPHTSKNVR